MSAKYVPTAKMVEFLDKMAEDLGSDRLRAVSARLLELDNKSTGYRSALDQIHRLSSPETEPNAKSPSDEQESE